MKIVFFGTPDFAVASLEALLRSGRDVPLVVTQPDQPAGRGKKLAEPAVKRFALAKGLVVEQPRKLRDETFLRSLRESGAKMFVVVAYGRILPNELLAIPDQVLNVHASLLPRWRGAAPMARAILAGDANTGVSIMRIVEELDAGDVLVQKETSIGPDETTGELGERLSRIGADELVAALETIARGGGKFTPQDRSHVTFAPQVASSEAQIDWTKPAEEIHNRVRAFNPWPGAFTSDGKARIKLHRTGRTGEKREGMDPGSLRAREGRLWVAADDSWLEVLELQREGKARQTPATFLPGYSVSAVARWR